MKRRILTVVLLLALMPASLLLAGAEGRLKGVVQNQDGEPIVGARITLMAQEVSATRQTTSKKGGKFVMIVADATRSYMIRIVQDGYQTIQEPVKLNIGGQVEKTWTMHAGESVTGASVVEVHAPGAKVYNEGANAFNRGEVDLALAKFREAGEANPELAEAFQGQAMIHWSRKETNEALAAAETLVALDPTNVLGQRVRYDAYVELGDERADAALEELITADPSPATARRVFNAGVAAVRANDAERAIARFEKVVELDPTLAKAHQILGQLYNTQGEHDRAIASAETLLAMAPDSAEAHSILYEAYRAKGDTEKAAASWAILEQADPEDLARALAEEGRSLFDAGQMAEATAKLEQAVKLDPEHPMAHYTLGLCYLNAGDQTAAKEHLRIAALFAAS